MKLTKKCLTIALSALLSLSLLAGCSGASGSSSAAAGSTSAAATGEGEFKVGLIQLMEHPSLDEIRTAIENELAAKAEEEGFTYTYDYQNAQGDTATIANICQKFVSDDVDVIVAIATQAAQGAATAVEGTDIPVIFSAVTDPVAAGLVENTDAPEGNITGTSDAIPVSKIFDLAAELTPDVQSFGLIYNTSEINSVSVIEETKA